MENYSLCTNILFLVLFICQMLFGCCVKAYNANISCNEIEQRALLDFKKGLIDKSNRLSSWTGENCCTWEGIGCNMHTGRVVKIDLHRNPLAFDEDRYSFPIEDYLTYYEIYSPYYDNFLLGGSISPSLLNLKYLQHLDLSGNNFSGIQIPSYFESFKYMRYLNLSHARFYGQIPANLGNLSRLQYLDLGGNFELTSKSLWWITALSSLKNLELSFVHLGWANDWLEAVNMLPSLSQLNLVDCHLQNLSLVSNINLTSLVSLDLGGNYFNTSFPLWLFNLSSIEILNLGENSFQGKLPNLFEKLTSLSKFLLFTNNFKFSFPNSLCTLTSLTYIDLSHNSFQGKLPSCLENLTSLTALKLGSNEFQGTILFEIGNLIKLTELDLSYNHLNGTIPPTLWQLIELKTLHLYSNKLSGTIPPGLGQLEKLRSLDIFNNSFTGELTEIHFAKLTELKILEVSRNFLHLNVSTQWFPPFQLRGIYMNEIQVGPQFPPWLETQKRVETLRMNNAGISDTIPAWFEVIYSQAYFLDLSLNQITGPQFPPLDANRTIFPLGVYFLNDNGFTGNIPSTICDQKSLKVLDLSNNHLSGEIPSCLGNLQYLIFLNLANNSLYGRIPGSLGDLQESLEILLLNENNFSGNLPPSFQNLTGLVVLDLGNNQLSGTLPRWLGLAFQQLEWLRLQSNNLNGGIPSILCQLFNLRVLNLARNNFTGFIPRCFGNFSAMKIKIGYEMENFPVSWGFSTLKVPGRPGPFVITKRQLFSNIYKGREIKYSVGSSWASSIALSENKIVGEIPRELMDLTRLQSLTLSKNHLHGRIPDNIGNLKSLESLDLSMNELSGPVPPSLATIDSLGYLNLSFNNLSGPIPRGNHFQTFDDKSIYEGNRGLCGKQLSDSCTDDKPSKQNGYVNLDQEESSDIPWFYAGIGPGFAAGFVGVFFVLWFKKSWRYAYFRFVENLCSRMRRKLS